MTSDIELTVEEARKLVTLPVEQRPRVYGVIKSGLYAGQTVRIASEYYLDREEYAGILVSSMTEMDLINNAREA